MVACRWLFLDHATELGAKAEKRMAVFRRSSSATSGYGKSNISGHNACPVRGPHQLRIGNITTRDRNVLDSGTLARKAILFFSFRRTGFPKSLRSQSGEYFRSGHKSGRTLENYYNNERNY